MYLKLKANETFTNPETDEVHTELTGGVILIKTETRQKRTGFLLEFHETRERMEQGKKPEFKLSFNAEDIIDEDNPVNNKTDFTDIYIANPNTGMHGLDAENLMYDFILNQDSMNVFEKVN